MAGGRRVSDMASGSFERSVMPNHLREKLAERYAGP
jgi:hypothetical protein